MDLWSDHLRDKEEVRYAGVQVGSLPARVDAAVVGSMRLAKEVKSRS